LRTNQIAVAPKTAKENTTPSANNRSPISARSLRLCLLMLKRATVVGSDAFQEGKNLMTILEISFFEIDEWQNLLVE
jgi:hypothetical protein